MESPPDEDGQQRAQDHAEGQQVVRRALVLGQPGHEAAEIRVARRASHHRRLQTAGPAQGAVVPSPIT
ncbi:MAG TPA: hypothetical protein VE175_14590 [Woeseiaceae bacterium]|nr:hypothetical protein [Woeseiaceae bacterium]